MNNNTSLTSEIVEKFKAKKDVWLVAEDMRIDVKIVRYHLKKEGIELPKGSFRNHALKMGSVVSEFHAAVGAKVAYLRMEKGIPNPADFAYTAGISTRKYGGIERGQSDATISDLRRIAKGLGVGISELFTPLTFS